MSQNLPVPVQLGEPDPSSMGPAMQALTPKQRMYVLYAGEYPQLVDTALAKAAGFGGESEGGLRVIAHRVANNPRVQAALREEADKRIRSHVLLAASAIGDLIRNPNHKDHFKAVKLGLEMADLQVVSKQEITVTHERTDAETIAYLTEQARKLSVGKDMLKAMLGPAAASVIDAEFTEAPEGSDPENMW